MLNRLLCILLLTCAAWAQPLPRVALTHSGLEVGANRLAPNQAWLWKSLTGLGEPTRTVRLANILHIYDAWGIVIYERLPGKKKPEGSISAVTVYLRSGGDKPVYPRGTYSGQIQLENLTVGVNTVVTAQTLRNALKGWKCQEIVPTTLQFGLANIHMYADLTEDLKHLSSISVNLSD